MANAISMVRTKDPDLGLWNLPVSKLTIFLDVHVHGISQIIGLTKHNSATLNSAKQITERWRLIHSEDTV